MMKYSAEIPSSKLNYEGTLDVHRKYSLKQKSSPPSIRALPSIMADLCKLAGNVEQNYGLCCSWPSWLAGWLFTMSSGGGLNLRDYNGRAQIDRLDGPVRCRSLSLCHSVNLALDVVSARHSPLSNLMPDICMRTYETNKWTSSGKGLIDYWRKEHKLIRKWSTK